MQADVFQWEAVFHVMSNREKDDERWAKKWLESQGHSSIERSEDDPPDYVVDGKFAVEVRRLNRRIEINGQTEGEENSRISLRQTIESTLAEIDPPGNERRWEVDCEYDFSRRLPNRKIVKNQIRETLIPLIQKYDTPDTFNQFMPKYVDYDRHVNELDLLNPLHLCLPCGICLEVGERYEYTGSPGFYLNNVSDLKGIGIADKLINNIQPCIEEKSLKVIQTNKLNDFQEWWLILIDHICIVPISILGEWELQALRESIQDRGFWSRIILISSMDADCYHEL